MLLASSTWRRSRSPDLARRTATDVRREARAVVLAHTVVAIGHLAPVPGLAISTVASPPALAAVSVLQAAPTSVGENRSSSGHVSKRARRRVDSNAREDEDTMHTIRILLISGSLRTRSTNSSVLRTARSLAPQGVVATLYEGTADLPHFSPDDDVEPLHPAVAVLRGEIRRADALLLSTPEYAGGLPGSFKNLLDWTIGDDQIGSINEKPVAWINASTRGAEGAHESLRHVLGYANAVIVEAACTRQPVTAAMIGPDALVSGAEVRASIAAALRTLAGHAAPEHLSGP